ncbi:MAG: acetyl-CoA carboxylase, biotin carboxyl carrier protein [Epulopiscium sp. Nele67-Bin004]|nr:MAG: acetyl-CoA carboxylase, biotin carboxyl carrier protein [Epulopiscium sp. Nele67-Bin004]
MKIEDIKSLIKEFKDSDLSALQLKDKEFEIKLERSKEVVTQTVLPQITTGQIQQPVAQVSEQPIQAIAGEDIVSPMVGTFFVASAPGEKPFVSVGDVVQKGQVVCIIEAMKLMNEVEADKSGVIKQIVAQDGQMVEFGETLFIIQ